MKGIIFTEFLEMVEGQYGYQVTDQIITQSNLPSGGIYSAVGTYPYPEMVALLTQLSQHTGSPIPELLQVFGRHLFGTFTRGYAHFFEQATSAFDFLSQIQNYIHVEVLKLYPDAELPDFQLSQPKPHILLMEYRSERGLADLAEGLIASAIGYFGDPIQIHRKNLSPDSTHVLFTLTQEKER